ncbi:MAG: hypothetical protein ACSHX6_05380 [Akkermansiaceae bacterium]
MSEIRDEVGVLVTGSLGGRDGEVDGRVAEVVGSVDEGALVVLKGVFAGGGRVVPWYKYRCWWRLGLWVVFLVMMVCSYFVGRGQVRDISMAVATSGFSGGYLSTFSKSGSSGELGRFSEEEKRFLGGDPVDLWMGDRGDKGYAADYVISYESMHGVFPADLLEIGKEADPDNPWYLYLKVAELDSEAVEVVKPSGVKNNKFRMVRKYTVLDEGMYEEALGLLEEADGMGRLVQHRYKLLERRLGVYKSKMEPNFRNKAFWITEAISHSYGGMHYLRVVEMFGAKFYELSLNGDRGEVEKWLGIYERFVGAILEDENNLIEMLIVKAALTGNLSLMKAAAERVGLDNEADRVEACLGLLEGNEVLLKAKRDANEPPDAGICGVFGRYMFDSKVSLEGRQLGADDFAWERNGDHSLLTKWLALVMSVILMVMLFFGASYLLYRGKLGRVMGSRLIGVLSWKEWVGVVCFGVLFPILFYYVINQFSSLGVRRWGIFAGGGYSVLVQFVSMVLLVLWMSYVCLRWRLSVRLPGVVRGNGVWEWLAVAGALGSLLLVGWSGYEMGWVICVCLGLLMYSFGYFLVRGMRGLIDQRGVMAVAVMNHGMISLMALFSILMMLMVPFYYADEQRCVREDELFTFDPEKYFEDEHSWEVRENMRKELKGYLEMIRR